MPPGDGATPRGTWQRDRSATAKPIREKRPPRCGGPDYTAEDRAEFARQRAERRELWLRELAELEERKQRRAAAAKERSRHRSEANDDDDDDEDEDAIKEPERYAVTLLKQDDGAWDRVHDDSGSGVLG